MTQYTAPTVDASVPWEIRRHLQMFYTNMTDTNQAFSVIQGQLAKLKTGNTTTVVEGGGGSSTPSTSTGIVVNNQSGVTSYGTVAGDNGALLIFADSSAITVTLKAQSTPWAVYVMNQGALGAGTINLTPDTSLGASTISYAGNPGASSMPLLPTYGAVVAYAGSDWFAWSQPIVPLGFTSVPHEWINAYDASTGLFSATRPDYSDLTGLPQLPNTESPVAHEFLTAYNSVTGNFSIAQPVAADVIPASSTTSGRPTGIATGFMDFDTTLGIPIWWNGSAWVNASGSPV